MVKSLRHIDIDAEIVTTNDNGNTLLDVPSMTCTNTNPSPQDFLQDFRPTFTLCANLPFPQALQLGYGNISAITTSFMFMLFFPIPPRSPWLA
jgi:hypothetical protein